MLSLTLQAIVYGLYVTLHNLLFALLVVALIRIFLVKITPYSSYYVACYTFAHSAYGGCPLLEIQNRLAIPFGIPAQDIGTIYTGMGELGGILRVTILISSLLLFYTSYKTWNNLTLPVAWVNIFRKLPV